MDAGDEFIPRVQDFFRHEHENTLRLERGYDFVSDTGHLIHAVLKQHFDMAAHARFLSCYIPPTDNVAAATIGVLEHRQTLIEAQLQEVKIVSGSPSQRPHSMNEMPLTKKIILYLDVRLADSDRKLLDAFGDANGLVLEVKDQTFLQFQQQCKKPLAFISHDSRNKKKMAKPLAIALGRILCPVWYDEFSLRPGQSLKESIEGGLKECRKCVVLLTRQFLANKGWAKAEFDSVFTRERIEKERIILPIWFRVTSKEVYNYCPLLADTVAIKWVNQSKAGEVAVAIKKEVTAQKANE